MLNASELPWQSSMVLIVKTWNKLMAERHPLQWTVKSSELLLGVFVLEFLLLN